ncbi:MAG: TonB C-terminal domain-containing protein [Acidobacteria bacterium]|nr:TonB C-terminal domain-containing protein [Acidobacteriota bacterium]MDW7984731.1 TonB family protein [Acidobacteriota bacterium]
MNMNRAGHRVGWVVSVLLHLSVLMAFARWGRPAFSPGTVARLGGGGASIRVDLLESVGPPASPPPVVPRAIRKYEEPPPAPPPRPDDMPEPPEKPSAQRSPSERPTVAPNIRAPRTAQPVAPPVPGPTTPGTAVQMGIGSGAGTGGDEGLSGIVFPYQDYIQALKWRIRTNWRPLVPPRGESTLYQARVFFTLNRAGQVIEFKILESSGDPQYDMSIERAVRLAAPFPALPPAYAGETLSFDIVFRYKP